LKCCCLSAGILFLLSVSFRFIWLIKKEVPLVDTGASPGSQRSYPGPEGPYQVLAAKNATLRLRAASGHVFSFTDLTSAHGAVNFGHLNPAIDPLIGLASDVASGFYPPAATAHSAWLRRQLKLDAHAVIYQVGADAAMAAAVRMAQRARPGKVLTVAGSVHAQLGDAARIAPGSDFTAWQEISCVVYEPIQSASGYVPLPLPWLRGLSQSAQAAGVTVIADEIACGFYRFGKLSMAASEYLRPDIFLFGNSMTNGLFPAAAIVCPDKMRSESFDEASQWTNPFQTSALGFLAADAVARYIDDADIESQIVQLNGILSESGERLAANSRLGAFHLAGPTLSLEVRGQRAGELAAACRARGVLVGVSVDGHRVTVAPPLTISPDQLTNAMNVLELAAGAL
jgi:acetylornithine/succinyldiaminopimelate/putrescine aminotransferase